MILYFLIALLATIIGSLSGLGGGVIIKPALQALTGLDIFMINIVSSVSVFFMAISTLYKRNKDDKTLYKYQYRFLILGSLFGGVIGSSLFQEFLILFADDDKVAFIQTLLLTILLVLVLLKNYYIDKLPVYESKLSLFIIGLLLAIVATFLGIGGGPINVLVCMALLGMSLLNATYVSILIIFFAQFSNILIYIFTGAFIGVDIIPLLIFIPTSLVGGIIGGKLSQSLSEKTIHILFDSSIFELIALNLYNLSLYI